VRFFEIKGISKLCSIVLNSNCTGSRVTERQHTVPQRLEGWVVSTRDGKMGWWRSVVHWELCHQNMPRRREISWPGAALQQTIAE